MIRILLILVLPIWLGATPSPPALLILVNGKPVALKNDTLEIKSSDHLTIFDITEPIDSGLFSYKLLNDTVEQAQIAFFTDLKAGTYTLYVDSCKDNEPILIQSLIIKVNPDNTWWYIPAFVLYLLILSGGAVYAITISSVRNASKIYTLRSEWTDRLHTDLGGDLLGVSGRITMAQRELKSLEFSIQNNLIKAQDILKSIERKLRFVFDLIDPKKNSLHTVLNDLYWFAQDCFIMKNIALDYQNSVGENEILKIDLIRIEKMGLLVKEIVNNVYKHSEATQVSIQIKREKKGLQLEICDNGKGFDLQAKLNEPNNGNGNGKGGRIGLKSLFSLAKEGLMDFDMRSEIGKGTCATVFVPEL